MNYLFRLFIAMFGALATHAGTTETPAETALLEAVKDGDNTRVKTLLTRSANSNVSDGEGTPVLMNAVIYSDAQCVRLLLEYGADPNSKNPMGATALLWAAGDPEKALPLLEHGADVNARSALGRTPLLTAAARSGAVPVVKALLERDADIRAKDGLHGQPNVPTGGGGATAVIEAAKARDSETLRMLLGKGTEVNATDSNGGTALTEAALFGNIENVKMLLATGGSVEATVSSGKYTPLTLAAFRNDVVLIRALLAAGSDVNAKDSSGSTPFMWAAYSERGNPEIVEVLAKAGADINLRNEAGETALTWAKRNGDTPIVQALKKLGARE
jgi:ankyrin repeat protein